MDRIPIVRQAILRDRPMAISLGWTAVAVVVPTALRWVIDGGASGIPFVTFFPAVLLATVILGWHYGALTAAISAVVANRLLRAEPLLFYVSTRDALMVLLFALACSVIMLAGEEVRRLVRQQEDARSREELLKRELLHRVKNMFTIVQSLAALTARHSEQDDFVERFSSRLRTLDSANDLLGSAIDNRTDVKGLIERTVEPFRFDHNMELRGIEFALPTTGVVPLALAVHELCTNAVKYGALSVPSGKVTISWKPDGEDLLIDWIESGGPNVEVPSREGLGSLLLRPRDALKDVRLQFEPTGVHCAIVVATGE